MRSNVFGDPRAYLGLAKRRRNQRASAGDASDLDAIEGALVFFFDVVDCCGPPRRAQSQPVWVTYVSGYGKSRHKRDRKTPEKGIEEPTQITSGPNNSDVLVKGHKGAAGSLVYKKSWVLCSRLSDL